MSIPPPLILKKALQRASYKPVANSGRKCPVCNSYLKKAKGEAPSCLPCYYRAKDKEAAEIKAANPEAAIKPNVRIGKL